LKLKNAIFNLQFSSSLGEGYYIKKDAVPIILKLFEYFVSNNLYENDNIDDIINTFGLFDYTFTTQTFNYLFTYLAEYKNFMKKIFKPLKVYNKHFSDIADDLIVLHYITREDYHDIIAKIIDYYDDIDLYSIFEFSEKNFYKYAFYYNSELTSNQASSHKNALKMYIIKLSACLYRQPNILFDSKNGQNFIENLNL